MTTLRDAARQALEALEGKRYTACGWRADCDKAITALRAALADPVQDVKGCDVCEHPLYAGIKCRVCGRVTQAKPVQEPVAWIYQNTNTEREYLVWRKSNGGRNWQPLYTAPPQRKPLTKIDLRAVYDQHAAYQEEGPEASGWWEFARAVERAHGIGGSDET